MLIVLTLLVFEIAAVRARCLILKTERELSVVGDVSDKIGVAYFLIGRWEPTSDLSFFTTSRLTPHSIWVAAGLSPRQGFKTLKEIWELLIVDDWHLTDLFCPPPKEPVYIAPLFAPIYSKYSAVPFCDDDPIDIWSLGVNAVSNSRSPPAGGEAM